MRSYPLSHGGRQNKERKKERKAKYEGNFFLDLHTQLNLVVEYLTFAGHPCIHAVNTQFSTQTIYFNFLRAKKLHVRTEKALIGLGSTSFAQPKKIPCLQV